MHVNQVYSHAIVHIFDVPEYGCHIAYMSHIAIIVYGDIDPAYLTYEGQSTYISTSHVIVMYRPATDMALSIQHIQIISCSHDTTMLVFIPHMNSVKSTM